MPVSQTGQSDPDPVEQTTKEPGQPVLVRQPSPEERSHPAPSFRPPDERPRYDADAVAQHGIRLYQSRRLKLYTGIEPEQAERLPPLLDRLFEEWEDYFGPLPPARDGSDYQLTGYVMRDQQPFRDAGLLPENLPVFAHGKHQGQQFWMNDQDHTYYRRHLLFHEATHCYMQAMGGTTIDVPVWYLEGMAELFATHTIDAEGTPHFRVVPDSPEAFVGYGRIEMIDEDVRQGRGLTLPQLAGMSAREFRQLRSSYAWSWVTCLLLDRNPRYREAFREMGQRYSGEGFTAVRGELLDPLMADFAVEWKLLTRSLEYGHDFEATAIAFRSGMPVDDTAVAVQIDAAAGWQTSGVAVSPETTYSIAATGQVTLADEPKPWISEPGGVTIRYAHGQPIGRLLGIVIGETTDKTPARRYVGEVFPIGAETTFTPTASGTLYLRVNDFNSELHDNRGEYDVQIKPQSGQSGLESGQ